MTSRIINQREVGIDTNGFAQALRSALRQDPDVILVGEMRDLETVETGLTAAETGHLVMSTVHTLDATETITRLIAVFPPHQHHQVRLQLASVLQAVVSQRLIPRIDGTGRCVAVEVMLNTPFVRDCIMDPERTHLIESANRSGRIAIRNADVRPIDLRTVSARATLPRHGASVGEQTPPSSSCVSRV